MSETQQTGAGSGAIPQQQPGQPRSRRPEPEPTGWVGWVLFAGIVMIVVGCFHVIQGLAAIFNEDYYLVGDNGLLVSANYDAWGWLHLIAGIIVVLAGFGLMVGKMWARVLAIALAVISALVNIAFLASYPVWSTIVIALDVIVIYALAVHGREMKAFSDDG